MEDTDAEDTDAEDISDDSEDIDIEDDKNENVDEQNKNKSLKYEIKPFGSEKEKIMASHGNIKFLCLYKF